jgi:uncharacterized membrane protein HdeD (DUF308 family)
MILQHLAHNWWAVALRGLFAILFGVIAFATPGITLVTLILVFGAFALVHGIVTLAAGFNRPKGAPAHGHFILQGLAGILLGLVTFFMPGITAIALLLLIAAWSIVMGIFEIVAAIRLRKEISGEWMLILGGIVSVLFGAFLVMRPGAGALAVIWLIGIYAVVTGFMLLGLSFRLKGLKKALPASA